VWEGVTEKKIGISLQLNYRGEGVGEGNEEGGKKG